MLKRFLLPIALALACLSAPALAGPQVELKTNMGDIVLELQPEKAPATVQNFLDYVKDGHYSNTVFHRVINGFMLQGGGFDLALKQKETRKPIKNEAANGLKNNTYTLAMARTGEPHSATAQFFINVADNDFLNYRAANAAEYGYCVFGHVTKGKDVVMKIAKLETGAAGPFPTDVPVQPVIIKSARILPEK